MKNIVYIRKAGLLIYSRIVSMQQWAMLIAFIALGNTLSAQIQCSPDTTICPPDCATITATITGQPSTDDYVLYQLTYAPEPIGGTLLNSFDDQVQGPYPIGFSFDFFCQTYTQFYVCSNGWIGFSGGQPATWQPVAIPSGAGNVPKNCIMGPWEDWNPSVAGGPYISYQTLGVAPNRRLVVTWDQVPMFLCTGTLGTFQIVLHENASIIDNHLINKPNCPAWAGGLGVEGVHNLAGTIGNTVPGRNATQWTTTQESWRWSPIQWYANGSPTGNGWPSMTVCPTTTTTYVAEYTDCNNNLYQDSVTVFASCGVCLPPVMDSIMVSCNGLCDGSAWAFVDLDSSTGPWIYSWYDQANNLLQTMGSPTFAISDTITGLCAGTYTVSIIDSLNCVITNTVIITEPPVLVLGVQSTIDATCNGYCDGQGTVTASGGTPPYTYLWPSNNTTVSDAGLCMGTHIVTVTDFNGCTDTAAVNINEPAIIQVSAFQDDTICLTELYTIYAQATGGSGNYIWDWNTGLSNNDSVWISPTTTTTYTVSVTDDNNCPGATATITIIVRPPLILTTVPDPVICIGDSSLMLATASGGDGNYTFVWDNGIGPNNGTWVSPGITTWYRVTLTDGCSTPMQIDSVLVTIGNLPYPGFWDELSEGCSPHTVVFHLDSLFPNTIYNWNFGDGSSINTYAPTVTHTFTNIESTPLIFDITLTATTNLGCVTQLKQSGMITVYPNPTADFNVYPRDLTTIAPTANFFDQSIGASSWQWNLGDGATSTRRNLSHTYPDGDSARYIVQLAVFNEWGCTDTTEQELFLDRATTMYLPNSFTPNGDGINDLFGPIGEFVKDKVLEFFIYNRWGEVIFKADEYGELWNGRFNGSGKLVQEGVYVWLLKYRESEGTQRENTGRVTLIR